jgi:hypothetical protein
MQKAFLAISLFLFSSILSSAQDKTNSKDALDKTPPSPADRNMFGIGIPRGLTATSEGLTNGYIMFAVPNSASIYLINRKGEVVHEWKGNYGGPERSAYLNDDGSIFQNATDPDFPVFAGGGEAGRLQKISWDSKMLWDLEYANEEYHTHHDLAVMPNGHVLAIAWEAKTASEALAAGRKPDMTPKAGLWPDKIVEIELVDETHGKVVWEWHVWDHLVQDFDSKKKNYGKPAEHPELLDFSVGEIVPPLMPKDTMDMMKAKGMVMWRNQTPENVGSEIYHFNAIKYNPDLDQIAFSSPNLSEVFIIDHSTTTKEAAGHTGGRWGKGGDFLYRWGNSENYGRGNAASRKLYGQHDIRWIEKGMPGAGHLMVYNNNIPQQNKMGYSSIYELVPPTDTKGNYTIGADKTFGPASPEWKYVAADTVSFWSSFISGAHRMNNGNTFINEGGKGRFLEVTKEGKIVWEYLNPYRGELRKPNGDPIPMMPQFPLTYSVFRSTFVPANHPALANKKLEPLNPQPKAFLTSSPSER